MLRKGRPKRENGQLNFSINSKLSRCFKQTMRGQRRNWTLQNTLKVTLLDDRLPAQRLLCSFGAL